MAREATERNMEIAGGYDVGDSVVNRWFLGAMVVVRSLSEA